MQQSRVKNDNVANIHLNWVFLRKWRCHPVAMLWPIGIAWDHE